MVLTTEPGLYIRVEAIEAMMAEPGIDFSRYLIIRDR